MYILPEKLNRGQIPHSSTGFTIVEALVALVVLTVALGPALILTSNVSSTAAAVKNNLIAANLAQEGIEVVRGIRDTNWFAGNAFDNGLSGGTYRVEWNSSSVLSLGSNPPIKENNGLYNYTSGTDTVFRRTITISKINASELRIISEITWLERGNRARSIKAESHLFNWK